MRKTNDFQIMETPLGEELSRIISNPEMGSKIIEYFNNIDKGTQKPEWEIKIELDKDTVLILEDIGKSFPRK